MVKIQVEKIGVQVGYNLTMNKLEKDLFDANTRRYLTASDPLKSHGPDHHWRVYQHA